jgi:hypothetical protein
MTFADGAVIVKPFPVRVAMPYAGDSTLSRMTPSKHAYVDRSACYDF